jgi:hypothetical protein
VGPAYGIGLGGGSIFFLMLLGFIIWQAIYGFLSEREGGGSLLSGIQKYSVLKLQVHAGFSFSSSNSLLLITDQSVVSQGLIDCSSCGSRLIVSSTSHPPMLF